MVGKYYTVICNLFLIKLPNPLEYGYEYISDFSRALWRIIDTWKGRVGECIEERNGFRHLRFHDTPGGKPDEMWIPDCLLVEEEHPMYTAPEPEEEPDEFEAELDRILGFPDM